MPRFAMKIAYKGTRYSGFQWQNDRPSVQGSLENAIKKLEPNAPRLVGAGRTDAGVHALAQVITIDLEKDWENFRLFEAMNYHLKNEEISVIAVANVASDFSARFSALKRRYLFRMALRRAPYVMEPKGVWHVRADMDVEAIEEAASYLVGHHDFTTFRSSICQAKSPIKTVDTLTVEKKRCFEGDELHFHVIAPSFLHNQVRSFVGTLERVGIGAWAPIDVKYALEAKARAACGPVSPPDGLYFAEAIYPYNVFENGYSGA